MKFITSIIFVFAVLIPRSSLISYPLVRISEGNSARESQFPYIAMVMNLKTGFAEVQYQICGGTIISKRRILTAAHCVYHSGIISSPREIFAGVGTISIFKVTKGCVFHRIRKIFVHEEYKINKNKDIAVLETKFEIEFGPSVSKLPIATDRSVYRDGQKCIIIGWGRQICSELSSIPPIVQFAYVKILGHKDCKYYSSNIDDDIICAGIGLPKSSVGDSGGPLVCNESLAGIVSTGPKCEYFALLPIHFINAHTNARWILNPTRHGVFSKTTKTTTPSLIIFFLLLILLVMVFIKTCSSAKKSGLATKFLATF